MKRSRGGVHLRPAEKLKSSWSGFSVRVSALLLRIEKVAYLPDRNHKLAQTLARWKQCLEDHLELFRCYYNFVRPHRALKFGREVRTPARQAGLTKRVLTFREIFSSRELFLASKNVLFALFNSVRPVSSRIWGVRLAA